MPRPPTGPTAIYNALKTTCRIEAQFSSFWSVSLCVPAQIPHKRSRLALAVVQPGIQMAHAVIFRNADLRVRFITRLTPWTLRPPLDPYAATAEQLQGRRKWRLPE